MWLPTMRRYSGGARLYDVLSAERPVYRAGRLRAVEMLHLVEGDRVLDVGTGTGLNLPLLHAGVGPSGQVTGLDASDAMLAMAEQRVAKGAWANVSLVRGDAAQVDALVTDPPYDALLFTYVLSIVEDWEAAWSRALSLVRPGGRVVVLDMKLPGGLGLPARPLARLALLTGGADPSRHPWRAAERDLDDVRHEELRAGHLVVVGGRVPRAAERAG